MEFETNKGRIFSYQPLGMSTNWKSEQTTLCALPGKEIIGLKIKHGVLIGTEQQNATSDDNISNVKKEWYCVGKKLVSKKESVHANIDWMFYGIFPKIFHLSISQNH